MFLPIPVSKLFANPPGRLSISWIDALFRYFTNDADEEVHYGHRWLLDSCTLRAMLLVTFTTCALCLAELLSVWPSSYCCLQSTEKFNQQPGLGYKHVKSNSSTNIQNLQLIAPPLNLYLPRRDIFNLLDISSVL